MTGPSRREVLRAGLGAGAALLAGGCRGGDADVSQGATDQAPSEPAGFGHPLLDALVGHFPYLSFDPAGLRRYLADYERFRGAWSADAAPDSALFMQFLMSTDFFQHGMDESRTIGYAAFCDPYISPCYSPFT